ncbi:MAG: hypothetical protein HAW60_03615 [Bdellovibrionales bacterium]|nr:hypothetical protein [Bdellovibrionales bacterium]
MLNNHSRSTLFSFFKTFHLPQLSITAKIKSPKDLLLLLEKKQIDLSHFLIFQVAKTSLDIPEFRLREKNSKLVEVDSITCSYLIQSPLTKINFCYIPYQDNLKTFLLNAKDKQDKALVAKHIQTKDDISDNLIDITIANKLDITAIFNPISDVKDISTPAFTIGKVGKTKDCTSFSLTIRAHHGLADALHYSQFVDKLKSNIDQWVSKNK